MNKNIDIYIVSFFFLLFFLIWLFSDSKECNYEKEIKGFEINSRVKDKFLDKNSHLNPTIILYRNTQKIVFTSSEKSKFYDFVEIGDSLIKERGSLDIRLIRSGLDTVITVGYGCDNN